MIHHFLLHGSLQPTNLEKNLKPCCEPYKFGRHSPEINALFPQISCVGVMNIVFFSQVGKELYEMIISEVKIPVVKHGEE